MTSPSSRPSDLAGATQVAGGCGGSPIYQGGLPAWVQEAGADNYPGQADYVVAAPELAAGFFFADRLRSGAPQDLFNTIVWVTRTENRGLMTITSQHSNVGLALNAEPSGPGYIYRSVIGVPSSGCWHFTLSWDGNNADVDLLFR
jgi:hypothetical protein